MVAQDVDAKLTHLANYLGGAYSAIASLEKRMSSAETELVQHDVKLHDKPAYITKPAERHSALPQGYAVYENEQGFFWRTEGARAVYPEPTEDLARIQAAYHFVRSRHEAKIRGSRLQR